MNNHSFSCTIFTHSTGIIAQKPARDDGRFVWGERITEIMQ